MNKENNQDKLTDLFEDEEEDLIIEEEDDNDPEEDHLDPL